MTTKNSLPSHLVTLLLATFCLLLNVGCKPPADHGAAKADLALAENQSNWILGHWTRIYPGMNLQESCARSAYIFDSNTFTWIDDADGEVFNQVARIQDYSVQGDTIKLSLQNDNGLGTWLMPDGRMHFNRLPNNQMVIGPTPNSNTYEKFVRCDINTATTFTPPSPSAANEMKWLEGSWILANHAHPKEACLNPHWTFAHNASEINFEQTPLLRRLTSVEHVQALPNPSGISKTPEVPKQFMVKLGYGRDIAKWLNVEGQMRIESLSPDAFEVISPGLGVNNQRFERCNATETNPKKSSTASWWQANWVKLESGKSITEACLKPTLKITANLIEEAPATTAKGLRSQRAQILDAEAVGEAVRLKLDSSKNWMFHRQTDKTLILMRTGPTRMAMRPTAAIDKGTIYARCEGLI